MKRKKLWHRLAVIAVASMLLAIFGVSVHAQEDTEEAVAQETSTAELEATVATLAISIDTSWVLLTGFLVFLMQLGFAILEGGMIRQTATVNALLENFLEAGVAAVCWWLVGFGIAFGADSNGLFGTDLFAPGIEQADVIFYSNISTLNHVFLPICLCRNRQHDYHRGDGRTD